MTIERVQDAYLKGTYTAKDLIAAYLVRIQRLDKDSNEPKLKSLVAIHYEAVTQVTKMDERLGRDGILCGPLRGILILIKDSTQTALIPTIFRSSVSEDFIPKEDVTIVRKLKEAKGYCPGEKCHAWYIIFVYA